VLRAGRTRELDATPLPLLTTVLRRDAHELHFFSTITTSATSRDVTWPSCISNAASPSARPCRALAAPAAVLCQTLGD
jgi:hypothetical protein